MDDASKTAVAAVGNPWIGVFKGVLQFVGGGLEALHEGESGKRTRPPESAESREARERLEGLGISTDQAEQIARSWAEATPAGSPGPAPTPPRPPVPRLSFDDFVRAAEFELGGRQPGAAQARATAPATQEEAEPGPVASAPASPQAPETPPCVPRSWEEFVQMAACAPPAGASKIVEPADRPQEGEQQAQLLNERIRLLEAKLGKWELLVSSFEPQNTPEIRTTAPTTMSGTASDSESAATMATEAVVHGGDPPATPPWPPSHESATIVQGPWSTSRGDGPGTPAVEQPRREPGRLYEVQVQRVTTLEQNFETFDKMMDGLAARLGTKGQPPS